jgi:hypothetical protein
MISKSRLKSVVGLALAIAIAAGCASSSGKLNQVSLGMTRDEVVKVLGRPHAVAAQGETELLSYNLLNKGVGDIKEFVVRLQKGAVESFGERASFGPSLFASTNAPAR